MGSRNSATGGQRGIPVVWLDDPDLRNPNKVDEWFRMAVVRGWATETDRLFVFTMAASVWRRAVIRGGTVRNPVGAFVRVIKRREEAKIRGAASQADEDWAREANRQLEQQYFPPRSCNENF
jgi:hypothetical protein